MEELESLIRGVIHRKEGEEGVGVLCIGRGVKEQVEELLGREGARYRTINSLSPTLVQTKPLQVLLLNVDSLPPLSSALYSLSFLIPSLSLSPKPSLLIGVSEREEEVREEIGIEFRRSGGIIHLPPPSPLQRQLILLRILSYPSFHIHHSSPNITKKESKREEGEGEIGEREIREIGNITHGFVKSDLVRLAKHALLSSFLPSLPPFSSSPLPLSLSHFRRALLSVSPSSLSSLMSLNINSNITFDSLPSFQHYIQQIKIGLLEGFSSSGRYSKFGITPPNGVLLYGPSGSGKTALAIATRNCSPVNFISVDASSIISKVLGESERNLAQIFRKARSAAPCILFIDQVSKLSMSFFCFFSPSSY